MARYVIKLGSSTVARETGDVRTEVLERVCAQAAALHREGDEIVLVTSGAIARGIGELRLSARPRAMDELQAASAVGQGKLFRVYDELLAAQGVASAQVLLTSFDMSARTHYLNARQTLRRLLRWRVVPVVNENDTTATDEITFGDNDFLAAQVAILLEADGLLLLTDTEGLYTADPHREPGARFVPEVRSLEEVEGLEIGTSASALGSGGMRSKVVAAEMATAAGIPARILNGRTDGNVVRARRGEAVGTLFHPLAERVSSFKLWLRYAKPSQGRLVVDGGAERALRERGTSLLPVGVVEVIGDFRAGDAVDVVVAGANGDGRRPLGKGIVSYSAEELARVKGLRTDDVRALLPGAVDEAVHRDYLVLD